MRRSLVFVVALAALVGCNKVPLPTTSQPPVVTPPINLPPSPPSLMTREECHEKLLGKTPEEVIALIGKPDRTLEITNRLTWFYKGITKDKLTGKADERAQIVFEGGKVTRLTFS